jgi:hypothetical protein
VEHRPVIMAAAILHDTCDKKYRDEDSAILEVRDFLSSWMNPVEVNATVAIIGGMSYSKVIKTGMPDLGEYQSAFNVVREADLMDAYDFDRSMLYHMHRNEEPLENSYKNACDLFETRVFRHMDNGLLLTKYARKEHGALVQNALKRMYHWKRILNV